MRITNGVSKARSVSGSRNVGRGVVSKERDKEGEEELFGRRSLRASTELTRTVS